MPREGVNCPEFAPPAAPFSHLVKSGGLFYLSGQVAQDPAATGQFIEGDVATQTARILQPLRSRRFH
jgi:enamine deaminase RidA (YjgF/YER057c/UK114 family)